MSLFSGVRPFPRAARFAFALSVLLPLSGCSTISDWFAEEEELEIRRLQPIEEQFSPTVEWETDIGDGVDYYFSRLRPVYEYGNLYVADRQGAVAALSPQTGKVIWDRNFAISRDEGMMSWVNNVWDNGASAKLGGLAVGYDKVFVGTEDGVVMALDAKSGETLWQATVPGEVLAPPAMDQNILVVNTGAGVMFGFDVESGEQLWRSETDVPPLTLRGISAPAAINGGAIVGTPTGKLQVNILESGMLAWETAITTPSGATELDRIVDVDTTPVLFGGIVYTVSFNGSLAAVELRSGRIIWKREYGAYRNVTLVDDQLFVVDNNSIIYALDRRTGVELWSQSSLKKRSVTAGEAIGDYLVVGDNWGYLHWLEQETGKIVARLNLGGDDEDDAIYVAPLKVEDSVIAVTRNGVVASVSSPQ